MCQRPWGKRAAELEPEHNAWADSMAFEEWFREQDQSDLYDHKLVEDTLDGGQMLFLYVMMSRLFNELEAAEATMKGGA